MPYAPRVKGKATDIAWKILGKPANIAAKIPAVQEKADKVIQTNGNPLVIP